MPSTDAQFTAKMDTLTRAYTYAISDDATRLHKTVQRGILTDTRQIFQSEMISDGEIANACRHMLLRLERRIDAIDQG